MNFLPPKQKLFSSNFSSEVIIFNSQDLCNLIWSLASSFLQINAPLQQQHKVTFSCLSCHRPFRYLNGCTRITFSQFDLKSLSFAQQSLALAMSHRCHLHCSLVIMVAPARCIDCRRLWCGGGGSVHAHLGPTDRRPVGLSLSAQPSWLLGGAPPPPPSVGFPTWCCSWCSWCNATRDLRLHQHQLSQPAPHFPQSFFRCCIPAEGLPATAAAAVTSRALLLVVLVVAPVWCAAAK